MNIEHLREQYELVTGKAVSNRYKNDQAFMEDKIQEFADKEIKEANKECKEDCKEECTKKKTCSNQDTLLEGEFTLKGADGKEKTNSQGVLRKFKVVNGRVAEVF